MYRADFTREYEWRCVCGCINTEDESQCWYCSADQNGDLPDEENEE